MLQRTTYCEEAMARAMAGEVELFGVVDAALRVVEANGLPAHADLHELGGVDQLNVGGLAGLLADAQTPLAHAATHQPGGADAMAVDAAAAVGSLRTLGLGAAQAAVGNHLHDGQTLQHDRVNSNGGVFPFDTTGQVQFSQGIRLANTMDLETAVAFGSDVGTVAAPFGTLRAQDLNFRRDVTMQNCMSVYSDTTSRAAHILFRKAKGTYAAPANLAFGHRLGAIEWYSWAGGAARLAAQHMVVSTEAGVAAGNHGCRHMFYGSPNGGALREVVRFDQDGTLYAYFDLTASGVVRANGGFSDNGAPGLDNWIDDGVNFRATFSGGILTAVGNSIAGGWG